MTPLDRIMPFVMQNWLMVVLACVLVSVLCLFQRRSRWVIALWLPSLVVTWAFTLFFVFVFFVPRGAHTPDDGFAGMARMFQAVCSIPIFLTALLLLFARPPAAAWRSPFLFLGIIVAGALPLLLRTLFYATQIEVSFLVTSADGTPMPGVRLHLPGSTSPIASTDDRGQLTRRMEHGSDFLGTFSADDYQDHYVAVSRSGVGGENLLVGHTWSERRGSRIKQTGSDQATYPKSPPPLIPIVMRTASTR